MPLIIFAVVVLVIIFTWIAVGKLPVNIAYALRFGVAGLGLVIGGSFLRSEPDGIVQAAGTLMTMIGIVVFVFAIIAFVRAILTGEFADKG
jgi:multidrug transporter EmrE-like cation transporter